MEFLKKTDKKILIPIIVLILILPTIIAVIAYRGAMAAPVNDNAVTKMVIDAPDGAAYVFDRAKSEQPENQIDGDMIRYFLSLSKKAQEINNTSLDLSNKKCYNVTYTSYNTETLYKYYFTTSPNDAFYSDNNGRLYRINAENAEKFVYSSYAIALYDSAKIPTMTISGDKTVKPDVMNWQYLLSNNEKTTAMAELSASKQVFDIAGALNLSFDTEPDILQVQIYNGENEIFNDSYANIAAVDFTESATLNVIAQATWMENATRTSSGSAKYVFDVNVSAPAVFYLGESSVEPGEFVVISAKNVDDPSAITFSSSPDIGFTPKFFADGEYARALVPISYDLESVPSYTFTLTYADVATQLNLEIVPKTFKSTTYNVSAEIVASTRTGTTLQAFTDKMTPVLEGAETKRYFPACTELGWAAAEDSLKEPLYVYQLNTLKAGFGLYRTISVTSTVYRHEGVDFALTAGSGVSTILGGKVVFAEQTTLSGKTVVVDHGLGLKTMYAHLDNITVSEGQIIDRGVIVGSAGSTGFTTGGTLHFGMYVFGVPVCPYDALWDGGIPMQQ